MCNRILDAVCQYKSIRFIQVKNKKLACIYYTLILGVLAYVVGYTIIADKGYQIYDEVAGTTGIKIKGSASIGNDTNHSNIQDILKLTPLDAMDLVRPSMEENAFFLTTAMTITPNQTQGLCDGNPNEAPECTPTNTTNCYEEFYAWDSQGMYTGECGSNNHCQLYTWCPPEDDTEIDIVNNVGEFTAFVKIDVTFDRWNITLSNTVDKNGDGHPIFGYNLFAINDLLDKATDGAIDDINTIAADGAIILVSSLWYCDLDHSVDKCQPEYSFARIDGAANTITEGFNYRTVTYDMTKQTRLLEKLHGLRVIFLIEGQGGKFNLVALSITFGAGMSFLAIATIISDIILERFLKKSDYYNRTKNKDVDDEKEEVMSDAGEESQSLNAI